MARSGGWGFFLVIVTALALLATPLPALALFAVNIQGPGAYAGAGITVNDNAADDLNALAGQITLISGLSATLPLIPGFLVNVNTAISNSPGGPGSSSLSLNWVLSSGLGGGGAIQVTASAQGYTFPPTGQGSVLTSDVGGSLVGTGSVVAQQWVDLGDGLFATVGPLVTPGTQGPFGPGAFSDSASSNFTSGTPYSITDRVNLSLGGLSSTTGGLSSTVVPEPVTMFLGGTGLLMLTYAARRRLFGQ